MSIIESISETELHIRLGDGSGLTGSEIILTSFEGYNSVSMRRTSTERLQEDGERTGKGYRGGKVISLGGDVTFATPKLAARFVTTLEAFLADGRDGTLFVEEPDLELTRHMRIFLNGMDEPVRYGKDVAFGFDLYAPDPYKYGAAVPDGPYPETTPITLENEGSAKAYPVITVSGNIPSTGFNVTEAGGSLLTVTGGGAGEYVIDFANRELLLNGTDISERLTVRQWTEVEPGGSAVYALNASNSGATIAGEIKPRWY